MLIKDYPENELAAEALFKENRSLIHWDNTGVAFDYKREGEPIDKHEQINKNLEMLLSKYPNSKVAPGACHDVFNYYTNRGDLRKAEEASDILLKKYPDWTNIKRAIVDYLGTVSNPSHPDFARMAIEMLDEIITEAAEKKDSELFEVATLCKGTRYTDLKEFDKAREVFSKFIKENPDSTIYRDFQVRHAYTYYWEDKNEKAIEEYKKILNEVGDSKYWGPELCFMIAACYRESGKFDTAIEWYTKTMADYPGTSWAINAKKDMDSLIKAIKKEE